MQTTVMCSPGAFCCECKEIGGIVPQAPLTFYCMADTCNHPERRCQFVQHGGVRP